MTKFSKILLSMALFAGITVATAGQSMAQPKFQDINDGVSKADVFKSTEKLVDNTVQRSQVVVYGIGGLGAIALGALAFFGRFTWSWFLGLIGGLVLIAASQLGIGYITGSEKAFTGTTNK